MVIYCNMGEFGHCVAYVSDGGDVNTACSYWVVPGTLEA